MASKHIKRMYSNPSHALQIEDLLGMGYLQSISSICMAWQSYLLAYAVSK